MSEVSCVGMLNLAAGNQTVQSSLDLFQIVKCSEGSIVMGGAESLSHVL